MPEWTIYNIDTLLDKIFITTAEPERPMYLTYSRGWNRWSAYYLSGLPVRPDLKDATAETVCSWLDANHITITAHF